jgi:hypothetical protein
VPDYLQTDRLVLRDFTQADAGLIYELNSDPEVMWFLTGGEPTPREVVSGRIIPFFLHMGRMIAETLILTERKCVPGAQCFRCNQNFRDHVRELEAGVTCRTGGAAETPVRLN